MYQGNLIEQFNSLSSDYRNVYNGAPIEAKKTDPVFLVEALEVAKAVGGSSLILKLRARPRNGKDILQSEILNTHYTSNTKMVQYIVST